MSAARRYAARFALLAFGLYHLPLVLNDFPSLGGNGFRDEGIAIRWGAIYGQAGNWIARHVLGLSGPMTQGLTGDNGDSAEELARLLAGTVLAAVAAAIWTAADRRRPRAPWVEGALHLLLRYSIILGLASYAVAKLIPHQFIFRPESLDARVGELSPMGLLWRFMEYSRPYSFIAGLAELTVLALLCFRRTTTLGALLGLFVIGNVAVLDLCYDVVVKLYSGMLFLSAAVLALYDVPRLVDLLVRHRAIPAAPPPPPFRSPGLNRARWAVKLLLVGGVLLSSTVVVAENSRKFRARAAASPISGIWDVDSFVAAGRELATTAEPARWRRVSVGPASFAVRLEDDTQLRCRPTTDLDAQTVALDCRGHEAKLAFRRDGAHLRLDGTLDGAPVTAQLILHTGWTLTSWTYEWVFTD